MTINTHVLVLAAACALFSGCGDADVEIQGDISVGEVCTETLECVPGSICFNEFCVGEGNLRTSLSFFDDTDLDLHLLTPNGVEIYFANSAADGGELDVDQCVGACEDMTTHVENIVFKSAPPSGTYEMWVVNYDGRADATFDIEVSGDGIETSFAGSVIAEPQGESEHVFFEF